ncbi:MAG TPA: maltose alpha-D-glucosyltransferase [Acidimicrobiales bacterium]|nr:maltose alpha-D-glucosyltransferase [Acidimicrobiales bacterium]
MRGRSVSGTASTDTRWYQRAVFYEIVVRGFYDSNGDGNGDLPGVIAKLDYLEWLGVDCIWLLPFYDSPLKDGGYDISDYWTVLPAYGQVADVARLVDEAHRRGIRVISDLVMNHTSDQHPWFRESRSDRTNPKADWYVWSDDDKRFADAPIIFVDTEHSNWQWDPQRGQYYWHRFFSHQPDLNFDNREVAETMLDVVRYWLDIGLDGFRLDAVPYLFARDGTTCAGLPETHAYLKRLRKEVDSLYPGKVLLAEANQWPEDVVEYFGNADECHMCFNFPLMPRMFMAVRREQRYPITEILSRTPTIPEQCSWGTFLRNHDELTLEMVSNEDRDYMWAEYARDPRMRRNLGIARRLAPLVDNDRRVIELLHSLLFSLPGSPIIYYGDEIGMGDNIYLGDRDTVRTPMQWSSDRNGGFSRADFEQLYLPPLMDPVYGYGSVNVEAQSLHEGSLLHWMRRMLAVRRRHPVFGLGALEVLSTDNPSVLAYVRSYERNKDDDLGPEVGSAGAGREAGTDKSLYPRDCVLCVVNLSRMAQPAQLQLHRWQGVRPVELLGRVPFPAVTALPYALTMPPYGVFWFGLAESGGYAASANWAPALHRELPSADEAGTRARVIPELEPDGVHELGPLAPGRQSGGGQ